MSTDDCPTTRELLKGFSLDQLTHMLLLLLDEMKARQKAKAAAQRK